MEIKSFKFLVVVVLTFIIVFLMKYIGNTNADKLENAADKDAAIKALIKETIIAHKRIIFNGNGYTDEWVEEAKMRGLLNLKSTPEAIPYLLEKKNIELFTKHNIFTEEELHSRVEILLENYSKTLRIEALTLSEMITKDLLPSASAAVSALAGTIASKKAAGLPTEGTYEIAAVTSMTELSSEIFKLTAELKGLLVQADGVEGAKANADFYHDSVFAKMEEIRVSADQLEALISEKYLTYPTYGKLLFSVNN